MLKSALILAARLFAAGSPACAQATDCPLHDAPFTAGSPLVDILHSPAPGGWSSGSSRG
jgi:hypothetical protein